MKKTIPLKAKRSKKRLPLPIRYTWLQIKKLWHFSKRHVVAIPVCLYLAYVFTTLSLNNINTIKYRAAEPARLVNVYLIQPAIAAGDKK